MSGFIIFAEDIGFIISMLLGFLLGYFIYKQARHSVATLKLQKNIQLAAALVFSLYLATLFYAVLFSFPIILQTNRQGTIEILSHINWIPFNYLNSPYTDIITRQSMQANFWREIIQNTLLTFPLGLGLAYFLRPTWKKALCLSLLAGFGAETAQLLLSLLLGYTIRIIDITDVILNTLGALFGFLIFRIIGHQISKTQNRPIFIVLIIILIVGLFTFRDYGLSWDEPLFYDYAETIPAAYRGWDRLDESVYGSSAEDHKYYGPAYLLLGRPLKIGIQAVLGTDSAAAWHLVNFISFILGVTFIYRLGTRSTTPNLAAVNAAFFALQPLLWGHAFINPKDMPFMTAFLAAVSLGLEWVDSIPEQRTQSVVKGWFLRILHTPGFPKLLLATLALGIASAIRVIGPLAGALVFIYFLVRFIRLPRDARTFSLIHLSTYILLSIAIMFWLWPFLWADPVNRLLEVLRHMSNNPTELAVLFLGQIFPANELPARYFPQMLALTLSEPFLPLTLLGGLRLGWQIIKKQRDWSEALVLFLWFVPLAAYNIIKVPSMYDGIRHFLFLLPPLFMLAGIGMDAIRLQMSRIVSDVRRFTFHALLTVLLLLPGLVGIIRLHPYQYTYYNSFAGPTYRVYENDYWLTCYKEAVEWARENEADKPLYIQREFDVANYYGDGLELRDLRYETPESLPDNALMLFSTRANLDIKSVFRKMPVVHAIGRDGVEFCLIKRMD